MHVLTTQSRWLVLILLLAFVTGCNPANYKRKSNLGDSLLYYQIQMNRSNFAAAAKFRSPESKWNVADLKQFQITSYEVVSSESSDNGNRVTRQVALRYLDRYTMRERQTSYTEDWVYNDKSRQWFLEGNPPAFR